MSIALVITAFDPKNWETEWKTTSKDLKLDIEVFKQRMLERWSKAKFTPKDDGILEWVIPYDNGGEFWGSLDKSAVIFRNSELSQEFALWFRQLIREEITLYYFHTSSWESMLLTSEMTLEDLEQVYKL